MRQLIKHEFADYWKNNVIGYGISFVGYLIYAIYMFFVSRYQNPWSPFMSIITTGISFALVSALLAPVVFFFISIKRTFLDKIFGDEGYLTMSIPVSTKQLLLSKLMVSMIWGIGFIIVNFLVASLVFVAIVNTSLDFLQTFKSIISNIFFSGLTSVKIIYTTLSSLLKLILILLMAGSLTNYLRAKKNKAIIAIGIALGVYTCISVLNTVALVIPFGIIITENGYAFNAGLFDDLSPLGLSSYVINFTKLIFDILLIIGMYLISYNIIDKDFELN